MNPTERLLTALREHGHIPKQSGSGWSCRCPAHNDRSPSLSINEGEDGRALVHCFTGCETHDVVAAIGLRMRDLMPNNGSVNGRRRGDGDTTPRHAPANRGSVAVAGGTRSQQVFKTADSAVAELERRYGPSTQTWTYTNAAGEPVALTVRFDVAPDQDAPDRKPRKWFHPVTRNGDDWVLEGMATLYPLYALPDLVNAPAGSRVYVCEGEKAADAARACGLLATTSFGGSQTASKTDWSPLAGHEVVILPDLDDPGENYADDVVRLATAAGAKSVRVIRLVELWAGMPEGGDIVDLLEHRSGDVDAIRAAVETLADKTEPIEAELDARAPVRPTINLAALFPESCSGVADYFAAVSRSTQTPVEMSATLGIAIASGTVCNVALIRGHGDHKEPAPLWMLVLSDPGTRKSAVFSELTAPIIQWEKRRGEEMKPKVAAAAQRRRLAEKRLRYLEDRAAKESNPTKHKAIEAEVVQLAQELDAEPIPTIPMLMASEPTPEGLSRQMAANHGRALLASAEADAFDIVLGRYSGVRNFGIFLKGHAGDAVRAQRAGRPGDIIDCPALAIALTCQVDAVRAVWDDPQAEGRGLLARFNVFAPANRIGSRDVRPKPVESALRSNWHAIIERLLAFDVPEEPDEVCLSAEADKLYHDFQIRIEEALGNGELADRRAWGGKLCGAVLRIALTLHALGTWGVRGTPEEAGPIPAETMRAAIAWADYLANSERYARGMIGLTDMDPRLRRLVEWIRSKGGAVTVRDVTRGLREYRNDAKKAKADLSALVEAGIGRWDATDGGRTWCFRLFSAGGDTGDGDTSGLGDPESAASVTVATATKTSDGRGEL